MQITVRVWRSLHPDSLHYLINMFNRFQRINLNCADWYNFKLLCSWRCNVASGKSREVITSWFPSALFDQQFSLVSEKHFNLVVLLKVQSCIWRSLYHALRHLWPIFYLIKENPIQNLVGLYSNCHLTKFKISTINVKN